MTGLLKRLRRDERGATSLTEVLCAMVLFSIVLAAILGTFEQTLTHAKRTEDRLESQDLARQAADRIARDLRNTASPSSDTAVAVERAAAGDLIVRSVSPTGAGGGANTARVRRVRYCLNTASSPGKLYAQQQTWTSATPPAVPAATSCPGSGWTSSQVIADKIVNGTGRPVFAYNAASATDVSSVHVDLYVDGKVGSGPQATRIATGVFLRNQNRRPVSAFAATKVTQGLILNGSASADPEGDPLTYSWYNGTTLLGTGIVFTWTSPINNADITLKVQDSSGLEASVTQKVSW